ncbi:MAG: STAS domain-containing protein [Deltaproteobacteria bacterium]|nr:STAS domain-containing protein [Candidatus Anaeroferrophillacea bacterium]
MAVTVDVQAPETGVAVLAVTGDVNHGAGTILHDAGQEALAGHPGAVVVDLEKAVVVDGFGLAHLLALVVRLKRRQVAVALAATGSRSWRLLVELGIDRVARIYSATAAAVGDLKSGAPGGTFTPPVVGADDEHEIFPAATWAPSLGETWFDERPEGIRNLNVLGRLPQGIGHGYGSLWRKTYRVRLTADDVTPAAVAAAFKQHLPDYWPAGNVIVLPLGLVTGAPGIINLTIPGGVPLATGIRVLNVTDRSFSFVPLRGHMEAGWITFGAVEEEGRPVAMVQSFARTGDPLYESGFVFFGHHQQERFWDETLTALAADLGVSALVEMSTTCIDRRRLGRGWRNLPANGAVRTVAAIIADGVRRLVRRRSKASAPERS